MTPVLSLLTDSPYVNLLPSIMDWAGWVVLLLGIVLALVRWRGYERRRPKKALFLALILAAIPLTNLFLGLRLPSGSALPLPGLPTSPHTPTWMFFSSLPWMLAGGIFGPLSALIAGLLTGTVRALWDTHNLFTVLEPALLAVIFSSAVCQRYRTWFYRLLRQPLLVAAGSVLVYAAVFVWGSVFSATGTLAARLDYALTNVGPVTLAVSAELLLAGIFVQVVALSMPKLWDQGKVLEPSPAEKSLQARFLLASGTILSVLLVFLLLGNWIVAGNAARKMIQERMQGTATMATESIPFFLGTGQSLVASIGNDPRLLAESLSSMDAALQEHIRSVAFFEQFILVDLNRSILAMYPALGAGELRLAQDEIQGIELAFQGIPNQVYAIPPETGGAAAIISFMAAIADESGQVQRVLIGRVDLLNNPMIQPVIKSLEGMSELSGMGLLLDERGVILYHPSASQVMTTFTGELGAGPLAYDFVAPDGTRNLVYVQPAVGSPWIVAVIVPAQQAQQLALDIAAPLAAMTLTLALVTLLAMRLGLRTVTVSLRNLASEAARLSQGKLDHSLQPGGEDEVGQLRGAFEQMRVSLRNRLDELNQLLLVSQGVASSLEMRKAVQPVLDAVLKGGASAARVALVPLPHQAGEEMPLHFALGPSQDKYAHMDELILELVRKQERLVLPSLARARSLGFSPDKPQPVSLAAIALRHEARFYGVLWAAYERPQVFSEEDVLFLSTLAGQAALAAVNARLFYSAEVGRQRLAAILASTPDPVLVTDHQNRLLLANPAAQQVLGAEIKAIEGQPASQSITQQNILDLLLVSETDEQSSEVVLPNGQVYFATAKSVIADKRRMGRVCVLRDVTHFKELDALKSEFVSTVSHDLRSPLTLIRGYATMLDMVGQLNEQQHGYVSKIITGVEVMSRLVNNLLDLGRIEAGVGLQVEDVVLMDVVEAVTGSLQLQAGEKNIRLGVELAQGLPRVIRADRALLQQAIYNLVENAVKYTPQKGKVTLRLKPRPEDFLVEVQDNGIGIAPADQPRLFEKFYRGSQREARKQRGSGLGLAIVRSIAERHGGKVWLESQLGEGSTFFLSIPYQPKGDANGKTKPFV